MRIHSTNTGLARLGEYCQVSTGAPNSLYEKEPATSRTSLKLLTGKSLSRLGEIDISALQDIYADPEADLGRFTLKAGDVTLLARGSAMRAALVTKEVAMGRVVASTNFLVIRPDPTHILSESLVFYLNSQSGQARLDAISTGAALKSAPASKVKELAIPKPSLQVQAAIAELFHASNYVVRAGTRYLEAQQTAAHAHMDHMLHGAHS